MIYDEMIYKYDQRTVNARDAAKAMNAYCGGLAPQGMSVQDIQQYRLENNDDLLLLFYVAEYYKTASGNPASFADGADDIPVRELIADIDVVQEGSGTPSASNPRLFVKITDVTVTRTDDNDENEETYTVPLEAADGGIYGGVLNVTTGVLTVTKGYKDFDGTKSFGMAFTGEGQYPCFIGPTDFMAGADVSADAWCTRLEPGNIASGTLGYGFQLYTSDGKTNVKFRFDGMPETREEMKALSKTWYDAGKPLAIVYTLASPYTVQLTPTEVRTLLGGNKISADTGDVSVTYRAVPNLG